MRVFRFRRHPGQQQLGNPRPPGITLLPVELLTPILTLVVQDDGRRSVRELHADRQSLSRVCKTWHAIVTETRAFWAFFVVPPRPPLDQLERQLARLPNADLRLALDLLGDVDGGSLALSVLGSHMDRVVSMDIALPRVPYHLAWMDDNVLFHASGIVLPRLVSLSVTNDNSAHSAPVRIEAPSLQTLHLEAIVTEDWGLLVGAQLLVLSLRDVKIARSTLLDILAACPNLHTLRLAAVGLVPPLQSPNTPTRPALRYLRAVHLEPRDGAIPHIQDVLPLGQLGSLTTQVSSCSGEQLSAILGSTAWTSLTRSTRCYGTEREPFCLREFLYANICNGAGSVRRFLRGSTADITAVAYRVPHAFDHLVELRMDIDGFLSFAEALATALPAHTLAHATTLVLSHGYSAWSDKLHDANLRLRVLAVDILRMPVLQILQFVHSEHDDYLPRGYLTPKAVTNFISLLGSNQRPEVRLDNVVITNHPEWKEKMARRRKVRMSKESQKQK